MWGFALRILFNFCVACEARMTHLDHDFIEGSSIHKIQVKFDKEGKLLTELWLFFYLCLGLCKSYIGFLFVE